MQQLRESFFLGSNTTLLIIQKEEKNMHVLPNVALSFLPNAVFFCYINVVLSKITKDTITVLSMFSDLVSKTNDLWHIHRI